MLFGAQCFGLTVVSKIEGVGCHLDGDGCFLYLEQDPHVNPASCPQSGIIRWNGTNANSTDMFNLVAKALEEQLTLIVYISDVTCYSDFPTIAWIRLDN